MIAPRLLRAYRAPTYRVDGAAVRIGRRSAAMDVVLRRLRAHEACFVTAWNPLSRQMPVGWNRRMQRRLAERSRRQPTLPADGRWRCWHEAHLLMAADLARIVRLARLFRQRAIVRVARRRPARLVVLRYRGDTASL